MTLVKAELITETKKVITCLFNPSDITVAKSNTWQAIESKGTNAPKIRFQAGQSATFSLSLTVDTTTEGTDVTEHTNALLDLMKVDGGLPSSDTTRNSARPPWVMFNWGSLRSFKAVLERLQLRFTYFASNGMPMRAKADLTLKQWDDQDQHPLQNPTSSTPILHTVHTVRPGETLDRVAARYYLDPTWWRLIAETNQVLDPLDLPVGLHLVVPELPVRGRG